MISLDFSFPVVAWCVSMGELDSLTHLDNFALTLCASDQKRMREMASPLLREKFLRQRGWISQTLAHFWNVPFTDISWRKDTSGKPEIFVKGRQHGFFSLSHSEDKLLFAWSEEGRIGVDLEKIKPRKNFLALAKKSFDAEVLAIFQQMGASSELFYRHWVAREALVKCAGVTLAQTLKKPLYSFQNNEFLPLDSSFLLQVNELIPQFMLACAYQKIS